MVEEVLEQLVRVAPVNDKKEMVVDMVIGVGD